MKIPTKDCQNIIEYLYAVLRGGDDPDQLDFTWTKAVEMMGKHKKLTDECYNFKIDKMQQWKIDLIQPKIDNFELDEQVMIS